jgi:hypothetical protein
MPPPGDVQGRSCSPSASVGAGQVRDEDLCRVRDNPVGSSDRGQLATDIFFNCGVCKTRILGSMHDQYCHTVGACNSFFSLEESERQQIWIGKLPGIIYSFGQIIKSIRSDWRSNVEVNGLLSSLLMALGNCYAFIANVPLLTTQYFVSGLQLHIVRATQIQNKARMKQFMSWMLAYAMRDGHTFFCANGIEFLLDVIAQFSQEGETGWSRVFSMCILKLLFALVKHTTVAEVCLDESGPINPIATQSAAPIGDGHAETHIKAQNLIVEPQSNLVFLDIEMMESNDLYLVNLNQIKKCNIRF